MWKAIQDSDDDDDLDDEMNPMSAHLYPVYASQDQHSTVVLNEFPSARGQSDDDDDDDDADQRVAIRIEEVLKSEKESRPREPLAAFVSGFLAAPQRRRAFFSWGNRSRTDSVGNVVLNNSDAADADADVELGMKEQSGRKVKSQSINSIESMSPYMSHSIDVGAQEGTNPLHVVR